MPTLTWIGKDKVVNHHHDVPYRVLEHTYGFRAEDDSDRMPTDSGNKIIHGDNLEALKSLLPEYEGRVKCIYIDPPYNTGNEKWVYNDNVNAPKIKKWLGEVVGKQGEDLSRHDKWLCMMYPRLKLLQKLLAEDGAIFISIDDNELANLKLLCDEIFGANNFIDIFSWHKTYSPSNLSHRTKKCLEYVLCYAKNTNSIQRFNGLYKVNEADNPLIKTTNQVKKLVFSHVAVTSTMKDDCFFEAGVYGTKKNEVVLLKDVWFRNGKFESDIELESRFIWTQDNLENEVEKGTKIIFKGKSLAPRYDKASYSSEVPRNLIDDEDSVGTTEQGGATLTAIFDNKKIFDYPKDVSLIEYIINFLCGSDDIILDSFAGSGTVAHAVLNLNKRDGGNRKFILVEMEDYAEDITAERVRRVMRGYGEGKNAVAGTGGAFDYYELGEPLLNADGNLNEKIAEERIREYIYYTETRQHLERKRSEQSKYLLDQCNGTAYYFYYERSKLTTVGIDTLDIVTEKAEQYVVYADVCTLPEAFMFAHNIIFKKIPRDIKRF